MMRGAGWLVLLASSACEESQPIPAGSASAPVSAVAAPMFDIEGFCESTMAVGRRCEGDDELMEGNKIGLCTTTLRAAQDDDGVKLAAKAAEPCVAAVKKAKETLPDIRTLKTLAERFAPCRALLSPVPSLTDVKPVEVGAKKAGEGCAGENDCARELYCAESKDERACAAKKKAGERCTGSDECLGRCSKKEGNTCVSYCGSG